MVTRILSVVGARPQFVKVGVIDRASKIDGVEHTIVHTGQHYDHGLSQSFFDDLGLPVPEVNLEVGSGSHAWQTGEMMRRFDRFLNENMSEPDWVVVYGDTNSTLAASLVAVKRGIRLAHVEAGLRSNDLRMPEERNRVLTDRISNLLFCPTELAAHNLASEGTTAGVSIPGDVMYDSVIHYSDLAFEKYPHLNAGERYHLATIHRAENTDLPEQLGAVLKCLGSVDTVVVWPMHPRTRARITSFGLSIPDTVRVVEPIGYLEMLAALKRSDRVITDSGGIQKEAFWLGRPCITLRRSTEWPETLEGDWNQLIDAEVSLFEHALGVTPCEPRDHPFGDGMAGHKIVQTLIVEDR